MAEVQTVVTDVSERARYLVLKAAGGRCALCGASNHTTELKVAPILSALESGPDQIDNMQALCESCLHGMRDDEIDFRHLDVEHVEGCKFCIRDPSRVVIDHDTVWAFEDRHPVTEGHHLIMPKRHAADLFVMTEKERRDADQVIRVLRNILMTSDPSIEGFNVGMNCGAEAGQSILHAHWHVIPRRKGDSKNKKGGIRGVIPERMSY